MIDAQKRIEMKLTAVFVEHNVAFSVMDHLVDSMKSCITDSKVTNLIKNHHFKYYILVLFLDPERSADETEKNQSNRNKRNRRKCS